MREEETNRRVREKETNRQTGRETGRQTGCRQAGRQTDRLKDRRTDRQTVRQQTDRHWQAGIGEERHRVRGKEEQERQIWRYRETE